MFDQIYCDMDEVLADFLGGAVKVHEPIHASRSLESLQKLGRPWLLTEHWGITENQLWDPIKELGKDFWWELDMFSWVDELLDLLSSHSKKPVVLLTTPNLSSTSYVGKINWIRSYLGQKWVERFQPTYDKSRFAMSGTLLIDDAQSNIDKFENNLQRGILFPSSGNHLGDMSDPVTYIKEKLEWMLESDPS